MTFGEVVGYISIFAISAWCLFEAYDRIQVSRGIFPSKAETTLDDIKKMRDSGHASYAIRRYRQMPENKGIYTLKGATKIVKKL